jgi:hypothetical protein
LILNMEVRNIIIKVNILRHYETSHAGLFYSGSK